MEQTPIPEARPVLPELPPAPAEEQPEEGFVPYCAEAGDEKPDRKKLLRLIVVVLFVLMTAFLIVTRYVNFYHSTMKSLGFDYRNGEIVGLGEGPENGDAAARVLASLQEHGVKMEANVYNVDEDGNVVGAVSQYRYEYGGSTGKLKAKSGTKNNFFTSTAKLDSSTSPIVHDIYDFCFSVKTHGDVMMECYDAFYTQVHGKVYTCEIWLMQKEVQGVSHYNTLYRYYEGSRLAAVRVLRDTDNLIEVYDISSYLPA